MRRIRLVFAPHAPDAAPTYLLINEVGEPVGRGEQPVSADPPMTPTNVVLVVPGVEAVARWLHLPTLSDAQARAAAALLLEDEQAFGGEPLHLALGPLEPDGRRLVVAVGEARMRAWLDLARTYGLNPDVVIPDHLLLPEPAGEQPVAVRFGETLAMRGRRLAFACEPELAPILLDDRLPEVAETSEAVERMLVEGAAAPAINLLQGDLASSEGARLTPRSWRRAAVLAAVLLASPALIVAVQAVRLNMAADRLERDTVAQVAAVLPKGAAVNDPAAQAAARLERLELAAGGGPAGLAAQLFTVLAELDGAQVESLIVSPDGALRAAISHTNYSDMQYLRGRMRQVGVGFREEGTREEAGRIVSDVILGVRA